MRKRLLLINPRSSRKVSMADIGIRHPPLGLAVVASLTPADWEIGLIDENFERFEFRSADLAGITAYTNTVGRAYEISDTLRSKGVPVVMGGVHASMLPDEASYHVDTVVVGEAEGAWGQVIKDFENGSMKRRYEAEMIGLENLPIPSYGLFDERYNWVPVQTARGCPMDCEFCSVTAFNGHRYRQRPVEEVLEQIAGIGKDRIFFVDDNLIGNSRESLERAKILFRGMIEKGLKKKWICQASMNIGQDDELLDLAARSGCRSVLIGIEAEDPGVLSEINKRMNVKIGVANYEEVFRRLNIHGIRILGAFIFGMDGDDEQAMLRRADYIARSRVNAVQVSCLTPLPGTRLMKRIADGGRLLYANFPDDWFRYDFTEIVFRPKGMTPERFGELFHACIRRIYGPRTVLLKALRTLVSTGSFEAALYASFMNYAYGKAFRIMHKRSAG